MDYIAIDNTTLDLEHYGRKGMHWGQHNFGRDKAVLGTKLSKSTSNSLKKQRSNAASKITSNKKLTASQMRKALKKNDAKYEKLVYKAKKKKFKELADEENKKAKAKHAEETKNSKLANTHPKKLKNMSDKDLDAAITRLKAEQTYKNLYSDVKVDSERKKRIDKILDTAITSLSSGAGEAVKVGAKYITSMAMSSAVNSAFNQHTTTETFFSNKYPSSDKKKEIVQTTSNQYDKNGKLKKVTVVKSGG